MIFSRRGFHVTANFRKHGWESHLPRQLTHDFLALDFCDFPENVYTALEM
jgi:hypothetical protein